MTPPTPSPTNDLQATGRSDGSADARTPDDADGARADSNAARRKSPGPAARFAAGRDADDSDPDPSVSVDPTELLELLEDDYARRILAALGDGPRPARDLIEACEASRATVYRRLNRLEEMGLVATSTEIHADGHHRKVFEARLEEATVALDGTEITARVTLAGEDPADAAGRPSVGAADD